ncbi:Uncharacterised protein [Mycobacteroides abscessus subsp. abscessus]|nr:Uncharacterised protein [Mycobacteroides abscessus subsp. abscessus]
MPNGPPNPWSESNSPSLRQNQGGSMTNTTGGSPAWCAALASLPASSTWCTMSCQVPS